MGLQVMSFKFVKHKPNTPEWLEWRRGAIGASDSPIILGKSPYKNQYELYLEKVQLTIPSPASEAMRKGHEMEASIRAWAEKEIGIEFMPVCIESNKASFMVASLDGINFEGDVFLECKFNNKNNHQMARAGKIVDHHYIQVQHQFGVLGHIPNRKGYYVSYNDGDFAIVEIQPEKSLWDDIVKEGSEFYERVKHKNPPELSDKDYELVTNCNLLNLADQLKEISTKRLELEKEEKIVKEKILSSVVRNSRIGEVKVTKCIRKGTLNYESIPELQGVDLETYRNPSSTYWKIS